MIFLSVALEWKNYIYILFYHIYYEISSAYGDFWASDIENQRGCLKFAFETAPTVRVAYLTKITEEIVTSVV